MRPDVCRGTIASFLALSDVMCTGYHAAVSAGVNKGDTVAVVDAMNFRIQIFNRNGAFQGAIGAPGQTDLGIFRPKALAIDSEDHIYLVEGQWGLVQVFNREGQLLYHFGNGTGFGNFRLPSGLFIDRTDHIYLVDSYNRRVQVFQYFGLKEQASNRTGQ